VPDFAIPDRHRRQAEALDALRRAIDADDPALAAVRVVDVIDESDLVVTDAAAGCHLQDMLSEQVRWSPRRAPDLGPTFVHTGRLLRVFHETVPSSGPTFSATRADFLDICSQLTAHLAARSDRSAWFGDVDRHVRQLADRHFPDELDVVTRFGDFGITNVFATPAHRVTAIDTLAACRMPALHDITYLITGMHLVRPQVASMGLALPRTRVERYERAFLEGYYEGRGIPWAAYRTWSVVRALERWSAKSLRHEGGIRGRAINRYLWTWVDDQLDRSRAGV